jgi:hypothetical protein
VRVVRSRALFCPGAYYNNNNNNFNSNLVHMLNLDQNKRDGSKRNNNESTRGTLALCVLYIVAIAFAALLCVMHGPGFIQSREYGVRAWRGFEIIIMCVWSCSCTLAGRSCFLTRWRGIGLGCAPKTHLCVRIEKDNLTLGQRRANR